MKSIILVLSIVFSLFILVDDVRADNSCVADSLCVTSITAIRPYGIVGGTFDNGWKWVFNVTIPDNETLVKMKFGNFTNGTNIIPVHNESTGGNIRYYSDQISNSKYVENAITATTTEHYGEVMIVDVASDTADLSSTTPGRQIQITVEAKIPAGIVAGSYSMNYDIESNFDSERPVITLYDDNPVYLQIHLNNFSISNYRADAIDPITGDLLSMSILANVDGSGVDQDTFGAYPYKYYSTGGSTGKVAIPVTRMIYVVDKSKIKITLNGTNPQVVDLGSPYVEAGIGSVTSTMSPIVSTSTDSSAVNTNVAGSYSVIYRAVNSNGTASTTTRTVNVIDLPVNP